MKNRIDWEGLAKQLGTVRNDGESTGTDDGLRALELIVGESRLREAVDYYVNDRPGSELVRMVLAIIRPWSSMNRCYEIYQESLDIETKRSTVELLRVVADRRVLAWIERFLDDPDPGIQAWGAGVIDQLLWRGLAQPDECEALLRKAEQHSNDVVRQTATTVRRYLRSREESA